MPIIIPMSPRSAHDRAYRGRLARRLGHSLGRRARTRAVLALLALLGSSHAPLMAAPQSATTRASVDSNGIQGNTTSEHASVSADGNFVAFEGVATNLVPGDTNLFRDIFLRDRSLGVTERVSVGLGGAQANRDSWQPSVSGDGRFVAFMSEATNLVALDANGATDVFVRDRLKGTTTLVSHGISGLGGGSQSSWAPAITPDGRFIAFYSKATDLIPLVPDVNGAWDTFLFDGQTGKLVLVSLNTQGLPGNDHSGESPGVPGGVPAVSSDGRFVAFTSWASNLVPNDTNQRYDVFVRDLWLHTTTLVSSSSSGSVGEAESRAPSMSADGRYVAFSGVSSNLVPGDTNGQNDVFVKDRWTGTTERVDVSSSGAQGGGGGLGLIPVDGTTISADGRFVGFGSKYANLVPGDTNLRYDMFVRDRWLGETTRVSVSTSGAQANDISKSIAISGDGSVIVFDSPATNLVPGDTNAWGDVFVRSTLFPYTGFCSGDASDFSTPCPCANTGEVGHGCENSKSTGGGALIATGTPSVSSDTLVLRAFGLPNATVALFVQGTAQRNAGSGTAFGDGLRCLDGVQIRLGQHTSSANGSVAFGFGIAGDPLVSVIGSIPSAGGTRYYQVHYRDGARYCTSESFNWTNGIAIEWGL